MAKRKREKGRGKVCGGRKEIQTGCKRGYGADKHLANSTDEIEIA
jgi:hypothetical protein